MQSTTYVRSLEQIVKQLRAEEIVGFLTNFVVSTTNFGIQEPSKNKFSNHIFSAKEGFYSLSQVPDIKRILDSMAISEIFESTQLGKIVTAFNNAPDSASIYGNATNYPMFAKLYFALSTIIRFQQVTSQLLYNEKVGSIPAGESILEVELMDYDGSGIEISRIQTVLTSLQNLHDHISRLLGDKEARLRISFMDSGSDFVFAIQSTKAILEIVKTLFEQYWQKIRFKTYDDFDRKIESLSKGLKFVELVQDQTSRNVIDEETGRILKYSILDEMTNLTAVGATLKEIDLDERVDRRKLLVEKRGIKLLGPTSESH